MIATSKVVELFDGTGPQQGADVGASENAMVYFPGGSGSLQEVSRMIQEAGPSGLAQAGGARRRSRRNRKQRSRRSRSRSCRSRRRN